MRCLLRLAAVCLCVSLASCDDGAQPAAGDHQPADGGVTLRCAVIGGLADTGLWQELGKRFEAESGHRLEIVARGPKHQIAVDFVEQKAHVIAMHSSDTIINLVADGNAADPQPWARNDFLLVGPEDDPAGVRGMDDAGAALRKIIETGSTLLVHSSQGSMEVLGDLMEDEQLAFDAEHTLVRIDDKQRQMLLLAGKQRAYTVIGRIPFVNGKVPHQSLEIMVQGDPRLRRPYLVAVAASAGTVEPERAAARQLVAFLRSPATQQWISEYGKGKYDDRPLFFPVSVN